MTICGSIGSILDYCNSLFAQCNVSIRQRLQRVQNQAAHLLLNAPPRTPSLPLLQQLHWLPVEARITYKLCLLMYRVVHRTAPVYLAVTLPSMHRSTSSIHSPRGFRDTTHQPSFHEQFIFYRYTNCLEQTTYRHSYLYNSVIVSIQTQDSPVHYIICCSLGLVTMYGAPELWVWGALENAILIG